VISITRSANNVERMFPISRLFGNEGHPSLQQEKGHEFQTGPGF
jgi:hypothetical protein